jgi:hypothetical protein
MGVGQLWVIVDELSGHHQVRCDDLGELLGQAAQLGPDRYMQGTRVDTLGNRRFVFATRQTRSRTLRRPPHTFRDFPALSITSTAQCGLWVFRTAPGLPIAFGLWLRGSGAP